MRGTPEIDAKPVILTPDIRQIVNETIRSHKKTEKSHELKEEQIAGVLRGLHLDQDWIEITVPEQPEQRIHIYETGDVIDDTVGPLVNHRVIVDVLIKPDGKRIFRDIQADE
jgi:hypothetical protein